MLRKAVALPATFLLAGLLAAPIALPGLQIQGQQESGSTGIRGRFEGMQRLGGEITAINGYQLTIKAEDGGTYTIVVSDETRYTKGHGVTMQLSDLKVGDGVMAAGNMDTPQRTLHAVIVFAADAAQMREQRANLGKTFITGTVASIDVDSATMAVRRPDGVTQTIGFDENTSFRRGGGRRGGGFGGGDGQGGPPPSGAAAPGAGAAAPGAGAAAPGAGPGSAAGPGPQGGESITLADIKVGDRVRGNGALKNGTFVARQLSVLPPGRGPGGMPGGGTGPAPGNGTTPGGSTAPGAANQTSPN